MKEKKKSLFKKYAEFQFLKGFIAIIIIALIIYLLNLPHLQNKLKKTFYI